VVAASVAIGFVAAGLAAPATSGQSRSSRSGPGGTAFYTPPRELPRGGHGTLIWARRYSGGVALPGAVNTLILYEQVGVHGRLVATSGFLAVPDGQPPRDGWPIVSWAHGTTGIADDCAPTRNDAENDQVTNGDLLDRWIARGYAVVRTDYEGLGTPGVHPYLDGLSEGRAMLDAVIAARELDPQLSDRVVVAGHSQGGHAALWAASIAARYAPAIDLRGAIAFAPVSHLAADVRGVAGARTRRPLTPIVALMLRGMAVAYPDLGVSSLLGRRAAALFPETLTYCVGRLSRAGSFGGLPGDELFRRAADLAPLYAALRQNDTLGLRITVPTLIEQGLADDTVFPAYTRALVSSLRSAGDQVTLETYRGVGHNGVIVAAAGNATGFLAQALR
jgi:pimeloyl-ACP methyl ester carboxylesterase